MVVNKMIYSKSFHNEIYSFLEQEGFMREEFYLTEIEGYTKIQELDMYEQINASLDGQTLVDSLLLIQYIPNKEYYFILLENYLDSVSGSYIGNMSYAISPSNDRMFKIIDTNDKGNIISIEQNILKWLTVLKAELKYDENLNKVTLVEDFEMFRTQIFQGSTPEERFNLDELSEVKRMIEELKENITTQQVKYNDILSEHEEEIESMKSLLDEIYADAKLLPKQKWGEKFFFKVKSMPRKFPATSGYLLTSSLLPEIPYKNKAMGAMVAFIADVSKADIGSSDIIDSQKKTTEN